MTSATAGIVTLLFTDLVDSTALLERLGDEFHALSIFQSMVSGRRWSTARAVRLACGPWCWAAPSASC